MWSRNELALILHTHKLYKCHRSFFLPLIFTIDSVVNKRISYEINNKRDINFHVFFLDYICICSFSRSIKFDFICPVNKSTQFSLAYSTCNNSITASFYIFLYNTKDINISSFQQYITMDCI